MQNCVSSPKGKPWYKVLGLPSLSGVNFSGYGQMLKCKILFHKEMSWCSACADNTSQDLGEDLSAVGFYYEKDLWDFRSLLRSQADRVLWTLVKPSWNPTRSQQLHLHTIPSASTAACYTPGLKSPSSLVFDLFLTRSTSAHVLDWVLGFSCSFCVPNARRSWAPSAGGGTSVPVAAGWRRPSRSTKVEWMKWGHCLLVTSRLPKPELISSLDGFLNIYWELLLHGCQEMSLWLPTLCECGGGITWTPSACWIS